MRISQVCIIGCVLLGLLIYLCWISLGNLDFITSIFIGLYLTGAYMLSTIIKITNGNGHYTKDVSRIKNTLNIESKDNVSKD